MNETDVWTRLAAALGANRHAVLLVVADSSGSSPGRTGFKMAVTEDGMAGSVGGGVMEVDLVNRAMNDLRAETRNPKSETVTLVHRPNVPNASGMICSGSQTVMIVRLGPEDLPAVAAISSAIGSDGPFSIGIGRDGLKFIGRGETPDRSDYLEEFGKKPRLFIVGGGHCALALSELMSRLGFRVALFDDRPDLNTIGKNVYADRKTILRSYDEIDRHIPEGDDVYVSVMTLGYRFDEVVIRRLFGKRFGYFGVLGSRAKMKTLLGNLEIEGYDGTYLKTIRTPIGLPIGSRTPLEIAVSIAAEIITVKNGEFGATTDRRWRN